MSGGCCTGVQGRNGAHLTHRPTLLALVIAKPGAKLCFGPSFGLSFGAGFGPKTEACPRGRPLTICRE